MAQAHAAVAVPSLFPASNKHQGRERHRHDGVEQRESNSEAEKPQRQPEQQASEVFAPQEFAAFISRDGAVPASEHSGNEIHRQSGDVAGKSKDSFGTEFFEKPNIDLSVLILNF